MCGHGAGDTHCLEIRAQNIRVQLTHTTLTATRRHFMRTDRETGDLRSRRVYKATSTHMTIACVLTTTCGRPAQTTSESERPDGCDLFLLNYAVSRNIKNFVYASSATIYGKQVDPISLSEETTPNPISFYAVGKLASERYLQLFTSEYGISTITLRLFNVYGPGQNLDNLDQGMASIFLAQSIRDKKILVKGSPDRFRDFVYIDDVVNVFIKALHITEPVSHIYNVSTGIKTTVGEVIEHIKNNLPFDVKVEFKGSTRGDLIGQSGSFYKLKKDFQMSDMVSFGIGIKRMIEWALNSEPRK